MSAEQPTQAQTMPLHKLLTKGRKAANLKLREVAEIAGCCLATVHRAESGYLVSLETAITLCDIYGIDTQFMVECVRKHPRNPYVSRGG